MADPPPTLTLAGIRAGLAPELVEVFDRLVPALTRAEHHRAMAALRELVTGDAPPAARYAAALRRLGGES